MPKALSLFPRTFHPPIATHAELGVGERLNDRSPVDSDVSTPSINICEDFLEVSFIRYTLHDTLRDELLGG